MLFRDLTAAIGNGIGKACALLLAREGATGILVADIDIDAANSVATECQAVATNSQFRAEGIQVDVTHEYSVRRVFKRMVELFERLDYCVNCAGVSCVKIFTSYLFLTSSSTRLGLKNQPISHP
jgi:NAD(P)-dependent dehydrogenase (short-subunit alcohol dehydrogenase family)